MTIWGGIVLLLIGALPFLAYPWIAFKPRHKGNFGSDIREATNLQIFEDQIRIYKSQFEAGELTSNEHHRLVSEAERILLDDTFGSNTTAKASGSVWLLPVLFLLLLAFSLSLYRTIGALEDEKIASLLHQDAARGLVGSDKVTDMKELYALLQERVLDKPENVFYWTLLGEFAAGRSEVAAASQYFAEASRLDPANTYLLMQHAQTLFLTDKGTFTDRVREATNKAFKQDPDNKIVLRLKGIEALSQGQLEEAILFWEKAGLVLDEKSLRSKSALMEADKSILNLPLDE